MKILSIRIKNLASIEGEYEIDFTKEPLHSAGIFAITGATGAGKSTILDALCLALFAKTPRHTQAREVGIEIADGLKDKIRPGDVKGILRKGTADGLAEVMFVGIDSMKYKATWTVRRAKNKIEGSLQDDNLELANMDTLTKYPEKKTKTLVEIERLIGLNFEQFTRSVLLAQGDFTAFLKAEKKEKSSLLEKLTGTDIYSEISKRIYQKCAESKRVVENLEFQIKGIKLLSEEEKTEYNQQIQTLQAQINQLNNEYSTINEQIGWHNLLTELTAGKTLAEHDVVIATQNKANATDRIQQYLLTEQIQDARVITVKKAGIEKTIADKTTELDKTIADITIFEQQLQTAISQLEQATIVVNQKETAYNTAKPDIELAKQLDTIIKEKNEQVATAQQEVEQATANKQKHLLIIGNKQTEIDKLYQQITALTDWKEKNSSKQPVAENKALILSKLEDAKKHLNQVNNITTEIENNKQKSATNDKQIAGQDATLKTKEQALQQLNTALTTHQNKISAYNINDLKTSETILNQKWETIISAISCWEHLYQANKDLAQNQQKTKELNTALIQHNAQYAATKDQQKETEIKRDLAHKILSKAQLETAKDVLTLRTQIKQDEECPVCGSTHHPYILGAAPQSSILVQLKEEYETHKTEYERLLQQTSQLIKTIETTENQLQNLKKEENEKLIIQTARMAEWQSYTINEACLALPDSQKTDWLQKEKTEVKKNKGATQNSIKEYDKLFAQINELKNKAEQTNHEIYELKTQLKDLQNHNQTIQTDLARLADDKTSYNKKINEIIKELNPYFTLPDWHENWHNQPNQFEDKIKTFSEEWLSKSKNTDEAAQKLEGLIIALEGLNNQLDQFTASEKAANQNLNSKTGALIDCTQQRKALFANKPIALVVQGFINEISTAQKQVADCKINADTYTELLNNKAGKKQQIDLDIRNNNQYLTVCNTEIANYITQHNQKHDTKIDDQVLQNLLSYTQEWLLTEKKWLASLENAILTAEYKLQERELQLANHLLKNKTNSSKEDLENRKIALQTETDIINKAKNDNEYLLRQDAEYQKTVGNIFTELKKCRSIYDIRLKLNDLIGSADGEKFRQIAQEYTLDILLGFANVHLKELAVRYKLERIPDTLALQVIDRDMGDEIRSVHSLSGGESFLVSLALALGLASLSSNKMKVESLFIDEGFGSLDIDTLGIAMDALERLHNMGRKVGVISHVREMTERIRAKINVTKLSSGKSKFEVVG